MFRNYKENPKSSRKIIDRLADDGLVTLESISSIDEFVALANTLGEPLVQDDTDNRGIKKVESLAAIKGTNFHTDRASMAVPPNIVLLYCQKQSVAGGESIFCDAKKIYECLKHDHPEALSAFLEVDSMCWGIGDYLSTGAIFNKAPSGSIYIKYRSDKHIYYSRSVMEYVPLLHSLMERFQFSFCLQSGQGFILQNGRWLHGATASSAGERNIYRILLNCFQQSREGVCIDLGFAE